jgi:hypothetical protein
MTGKNAEDRKRPAVLARVEATSGKGGILAAIRRSPLVGADLDLTRRREEGRQIDIS